MPTPSLRATLSDLASSFADSVLAALRTASLEELVADGQTVRYRPRSGTPTKRAAPSKGQRQGAIDGPAMRKGRLARRSPETIAKTLCLVVAAVKGSKGKGMRAEEIQAFLKLDRRELPLLGEGLKTKKLRSKGQKRATRYFAS